MVGTMNTKSLLPKLSIMMLTNVSNIPADLTQETSLNGKYLKGIPTALTNPDADIGNATHTHVSDGDHSHVGTVASHSHGGLSSAGPNTNSNTTPLGFIAPISHTHGLSTDSKAVAEASDDGTHTHNAFTNDLEHRTITFYKKTNTVTRMSRKSLPIGTTFFYSKTGTLEGLTQLTSYINKHIKGDITPGTNAGSNLHQHDNQNHNHPVDISDHDHVVSFGGTGSQSTSGSSGGAPQANGGHSHTSGTAIATNKTSTPITSGNSAGHTHDDISHEPSFKTLQLMQVNSVKMSNVGVPKNYIFLWLDVVSLIVAGWQVSDGTNNTIDMLDKYPKGDSTPDNIGGSDTHTHSLDSVNHSHTGASIGHSHSGSGSSGTNTSCANRNSQSLNTAPCSHSHSPSTINDQASQAITVVSSASNHDHGAQNSEPEAKTVAFMERISG